MVPAEVLVLIVLGGLLLALLLGLAATGRWDPPDD